jgi:hypothetical protein
VTLRLALIFNFERIVILRLLLNILLDYIISDVTAAATKVTACPKMSSPILATQTWIGMQQFM